MVLSCDDVLLRSQIQSLARTTPLVAYSERTCRQPESAHTRKDESGDTVEIGTFPLIPVTWRGGDWF